MSKTKGIEISDKEGIYYLIEACRHYGVEQVVICPGSRNAPLTISFNRCGYFTCTSLADERSAAFFAMGMAQASKKPVVVCCTSGSAAVNFAPALTEAYYQKIPLIAITSDRPAAWIDQGNGQTIRQEGIFSNFIRDEWSLIAEPQTDEDRWHITRRLSELFNNALTKTRGPVHLNVPAGEPLYQTKTYDASATPRFYHSHASGAQIKFELSGYTDRFNTYKKVMIIAGQMNPSEQLESLLGKLSGFDDVIIISENTGNLRLPNSIAAIDRLIAPIESEPEWIAPLMPDLLITLGGQIISKKLKAAVRKFPPQEHWNLDPFATGQDMYQVLSEEFLCPPEHFLESLQDGLKPSASSYRSDWLRLAANAKVGHATAIETIPYSDLKVFSRLVAAIPKDTIMHLANSSPVRYVQLFDRNQSLTYLANRGTSGIDGSTSTAVGFATSEKDKNHLLISGDVAFIYDSNGLWNRAFPQNLKIIVINNSGGGIFRIIEGPDTTAELEPFFEAHHPVSIAHLVKAFGLDYRSACNLEDLEAILPEFFNHSGAVVLEIGTSKKENPVALKQYFRIIKEQLLQG